MDPRRCSTRRRGRRLPRTRGDGPLALDEWGIWSSAPPHTRGWTRSTAPRGQRSPGSPAHAGMDPETPSSSSTSRRLPRTRGDGPPLLMSGDVTFRAPPHTRGWTRARIPSESLRRGSPAHAGMDPRQDVHRYPARRLPRTRGDGPEGEHAVIHTVRAPPHTRGWTRHRAPARVSGQGSPAHAGMDLVNLEPFLALARLPRTRGDGPFWDLEDATRREAPPHTRGWTPQAPSAAAAAPGSPAHAGMDPRRSRSRAPRARLPRTRGDGPDRRREYGNSHEAPPHTRGWTRRQAARTSLDHGSPAHAGMDPAMNAASTPSHGLPRTRGDGPRIVQEPTVALTAPPHTRGWTRYRWLRRLAILGSPAHAGMDPFR